jgi:hypothetical protein
MSFLHVFSVYYERELIKTINKRSSTGSTDILRRSRGYFRRLPPENGGQQEKFSLMPPK